MGEKHDESNRKGKLKGKTACKKQAVLGM